jgi:hypothetical protein
MYGAVKSAWGFKSLAKIYKKKQNIDVADRNEDYFLLPILNRVKEWEEVGDLIRASSLVLRILREFPSGTTIWIAATQGMDMPKFLREMCLRLQGEEEIRQILPRMLCDVLRTDEELPHSWSDVLRRESLRHHIIRLLLQNTRSSFVGLCCIDTHKASKLYTRITLGGGDRVQRADAISFVYFLFPILNISTK